MVMEAISDNELNQVAGGAGGAVIASGSFTSNTGTQLNVQVNWSAQSGGAGQKTLYVDVCANSYSLYSNGGAVELTANGLVYAASAAPVNYGGKTPVTNRLASFAIQGVSGAVNLSAVWHFNGTYSGRAIGDIRASGIANV